MNYQITSADLRATSFKTTLTKNRGAILAMISEGGPDTESLKAALAVRRDPDTIVGLPMSADEIEKLYKEDNKSAMLIQCGICLVDNKEVCFLTDDSSYGHAVLKGRGFVSCIFRDGMTTAHQRFDKVSDFLSAYSHPYHPVFLESEEELLAYLNEGVIPQRQPT